MTTPDPATVALERLAATLEAAVEEGTYDAGYAAARDARDAAAAYIAAASAIRGLADTQAQLSALLSCPDAAVREAAMLAAGQILDPASITIGRLERVFDDAYAVWCDAHSSDEVAFDAVGDTAAVRDAAYAAVEGLTDAESRIAALLKCDNAVVRETALLAVGARGVAR